MREIKFRAWDKILRKISQVSCINFFDEIVILDETNSGHVTQKITDVVLMQYTGLLDKNGKEIYEGDILMHAGTKYEVEFDDAQFLFRFQWEDKRNHWFSFGEMGFTIEKTHPESEIIGNVYANPELLK